MNSIRPAYLKVIFSLQLEPLVVEHVNVGQLTEKPPPDEQTKRNEMQNPYRSQRSCVG